VAQRPNPLLFGLGLLLGIGGALYFRLRDAPPAPPAGSPAGVVAPLPAAAVPPVPTFDPADPAAREEAIRATRLPSRVSYPVQAKYADAHASAVLHELIAAYDDAGETAPMGRRRLFILAVPPDTARDALATLVEDLRGQHLDAEALRIQVFDSKAAATYPVQAGVAKDPHLVATYYRDGPNTRYELFGEPATP
jgi:hypothetical protein